MLAGSLSLLRVNRLRIHYARIRQAANKFRKANGLERKVGAEIRKRLSGCLEFDHICVCLCQ